MMYDDTMRRVRAEHRRLLNEREKIVADVKAGVDIVDEDVIVFRNSAEELVVGFLLGGNRNEKYPINYYVIYTSNGKIPYLPLSHKRHWHKKKLSENWYYCYPYSVGWGEDPRYITSTDGDCRRCD